MPQRQQVRHGLTDIFFVVDTHIVNFRFSPVVVGNHKIELQLVQCLYVVIDKPLVGITGVEYDQSVDCSFHYDLLNRPVSVQITPSGKQHQIISIGTENILNAC